MELGIENQNSACWKPGPKPVQLLPAVAATTTAIPAVSTIPTTAATTATLTLRPRLVHVQRAPANLRAIQSCNGLVAFFIVSHFDKAKASRASGVAIGHDAHAIHLPIRLKQLTQFVLCGVEAQV